MPISTALAPPGRHDGPQVVYLKWDTEFLPWLTGKLRHVERDGQRWGLAPPWKPGQHVALVGKTREGKTTFVIGILATRKYVMILDPKGEDDTLEAAAGYTRVTGLPPKKRLPKKIEKDLEEGRPVKLIVGGASRTVEQDLRLRQLMEDGLEFARQTGGWSTYVDEYQILADQRMYRLGPNVERMLISAARDKTSVLTSFQAPAWVPKASTRQATLIVMWRTKDEDMLKTIARAAGRDWRTIAQISDELPKYHVLVIPDELRAPMMITSAPKIN